MSRSSIYSECRASYTRLTPAARTDKAPSFEPAPTKSISIKKHNHENVASGATIGNAELKITHAPQRFFFCLLAVNGCEELFYIPAIFYFITVEKTNLSLAGLFLARILDVRSTCASIYYTPRTPEIDGSLLRKKHPASTSGNKVCLQADMAGYIAHTLSSVNHKTKKKVYAACMYFPVLLAGCIFCVSGTYNFSNFTSNDTRVKMYKIECRVPQKHTKKTNTRTHTHEHVRENGGKQAKHVQKQWDYNNRHEACSTAAAFSCALIISFRHQRKRVSWQ